jgi:hypothetical protein
MPCRIKICQVGKKLDLSWSFVVPITFSFSCLESVESFANKDFERNPHSLSSAQSDWIWLELEWAKEEYFFVPLF